MWHQGCSCTDLKNRSNCSEALGRALSPLLQSDPKKCVVFIVLCSNMNIVFMSLPLRNEFGNIVVSKFVKFLGGILILALVHEEND